MNQNATSSMAPGTHWNTNATMKMKAFRFLHQSSSVRMHWILILKVNMWHLLLIPLILSAILGNLLVVTAVCMEKKLRTGATNKFIASLAVSDFLVGTLVMPFSLYIKVCVNTLSPKREHASGAVLCKSWTPLNSTIVWIKEFSYTGCIKTHGNVSVFSNLFHTAPISTGQTLFKRRRNAI